MADPDFALKVRKRHPKDLDSALRRDVVSVETSRSRDGLETY